MDARGAESIAGAAMPRVVIASVATVDGRISLSRQERLLDPEPNATWTSLWPPDTADLVERRRAWIERRHRPTAVLEGSGTFVPDEAEPLDLPPVADDDAEESLRQDWLPLSTPRWFIVVDGRGRVDWSFTGDEEMSLLVAVCRATPVTYLAYLRRRQIPYLIAGDERVNLRELMAKCAGLLGASCVVSEGGGGINAALVASDLVDEVHVVTVPGLVGGVGTPSILDGPMRSEREPVTALRLVHVDVGAHGSVWTAYELDRAQGADPGL